MQRKELINLTYSELISLFYKNKVVLSAYLKQNKHMRKAYKKFEESLNKDTTKEDFIKILTQTQF